MQIMKWSLNPEKKNSKGLIHAIDVAVVWCELFSVAAAATELHHKRITFAFAMYW